MAVVGSKAAVADHMSGVDFIDTSNADKPAMLGSFYLEGYAREVAAFGSLTYAVDAPTGVYTLDMTQPGAPEPIHAQQNANAPGMIVRCSDPKTTTPKLAVLVGSGTVQVYDLTKPSAPVRVGALKTPSGRATRAALQGSHAFVADFREGLQVVIFEPEGAPRRRDLQTTAPARDVAVAGPYVFVVVGTPSETPREFKDQEVLILKHEIKN